MDLGLKGKKVAITGGSRGIGRSIVTRFLEEGASVAFCARGQEGVDEALEALSPLGEVHGAAVDAGDAEALRGWVASAADQLGGLDIYVSNASGGGGGVNDEKFDANYQVDMMSLVRGVQAAEEHLNGSTAGAVVLISTTAMVENFGPGPSSYMAMKAAATAYAAGLSQTMASNGVRVNTVSPGPIFFDAGPWDRIKGAMPEFYEATVASSPHGRLGSPEEVANVVAFLSSPAASWVTGTNVIVDGGHTQRIAY
jgi:3-oxoacyl-[acyl-carrier protein] reductase